MSPASAAVAPAPSDWYASLPLMAIPDGVDMQGYIDGTYTALYYSLPSIYLASTSYGYSQNVSGSLSESGGDIVIVSASGLPSGRFSQVGSWPTNDPYLTLVFPPLPDGEYSLSGKMRLRWFAYAEGVPRAYVLFSICSIYVDDVLVQSNVPIVDGYFVLPEAISLSGGNVLKVRTTTTSATLSFARTSSATGTSYSVGIEAVLSDLSLDSLTYEDPYIPILSDILDAIYDLHADASTAWDNILSALRSVAGGSVSTPEQDQHAQEVQGAVESAVQAIESANAAIESAAPRPTPAAPSISDYIDALDPGVSALQDSMQETLASPLILQLLLMVVAMATVGFVLYGRRDA